MRQVKLVCKFTSCQPFFSPSLQLFIKDALEEASKKYKKIPAGTLLVGLDRLSSITPPSVFYSLLLGGEDESGQAGNIQIGVKHHLLKKCIEPVIKLSQLVPFLEFISADHAQSWLPEWLWARVPLDFVTRDGDQPYKQKVTSALMQGNVLSLSWEKVKRKYEGLEAQLVLCDPNFGLQKHSGPGIAVPDMLWDTDPMTADEITSLIKKMRDACIVRPAFVAAFFTNTLLLSKTIEGLKKGAADGEKVNIQVFAFEVEDYGWAKGPRNCSNLMQLLVLCFYGSSDERVMWNFKTAVGEEDHRLGVHVLHTFPPVLDGKKEEGGWTMSGCVSADFWCKNELGEKMNSCQKPFLMMRYGS